MYCSKCGKPNADSAQFCVGCGEKLFRDAIEAQEQLRYNTNSLGGIVPYRNGKALASYYTGLFSLIPIPVVGFVLSIIALVTGILGLKQAKRQPEVKGKVHAYVGLGLGIIGFIVGGLIILAIILAIFNRRK